MKSQVTKSMLLDLFNGELSATQTQEILAWRDASEENRMLFDATRAEYLQLRWGVRAQLIRGDYSTISNRIKKQPTHSFRFRYWVASVAAVTVLAVSSVLLSYYFLDQSGKRMADFGPPSHTAVLELSDGTHHYIGNEKAGLKEQNGTQLAINHGELVYDKEKEPEDVGQGDKLIYNKVTIPRGAGQYRVVLSDGSVVWLNSDSRLEYPVNFTPGERRVTISGEAFFDVARDVNRPFIVETARQSISVLGTEFNVAAYPSEPVLTTLVSGSVKVVTGGGKAVLSPGEQSVLDLHTDNLSVHRVSIAEIVSWKNGITSIENMSLHKILNIISRSYDVDFDLGAVPAGNIILQGSIPNNESLEVVLSVLSRVADVKFRMNNHGKISVEKLK